MEKKLSDLCVICTDGVDVKEEGKAEKNGVFVTTFAISWDPSRLSDDDAVELKWQVPMVGIQYQWRPVSHLDRRIKPGFCGFDTSMISASAPVYCFYDGDGVNRYTFCLDECRKVIKIKCGVSESRGAVDITVRVPLKQYTNRSDARLSLRVDRRPLSVERVIGDVAAYWEEDCDMPAATVPESAKEPLYSFWYSFHQDITDRTVEEECKRAYDLGFRVCIVDDGWQAAKGTYGYRTCGDWQPVPDKFPDMAAHVARVHAMGMKYILWFSVPFLGKEARAYAHFKNKVLRDFSENTAILDPRYREVREYLIGIYKNALLSWGLDGFKLDFIDCFSESPENAPYNEAMDIPALSDAVDDLMVRLNTELKALNPDILLEFRQAYMGPSMRKYGNMFRVWDCPYDYLTNRVGVLDLRMTMRNTAVHSDMLVWNENEKPEFAALQIIGVLFGVMQYSARLENMSEEMKKLSRFWIGFCKEKKHWLLDTPLECHDPQNLYSWVKATDRGESVIAVYEKDKAISVDDVAVTTIANGCTGERILAELYGNYYVTSYDCQGEIVGVQTVAGNGITALPCRVGGLLKLEKKA